MLLFVFLITASFGQRKAVFVILDGIPADVIEKLETPSLREIAGDKGYTRAYTGGEKNTYSQSPTISAVGYNHVLTGTWTNKHNVWDNDIVAPNYNYWNIFRIAKTVNPSLKTAIFSSWTDNRTKLIGEGLPAAGNIKFDYSYDGLETDTLHFPHDDARTFMSDIDDHVAKEAARCLLEKAPDLSWVYLEFTDDMGHLYGDSPQFYDAVKKADAQVGLIWASLKERMRKHGEEWMIVITTDHGRDSVTGRDHGGQTERERRIWLVTNQQKLNERFADAPKHVDIAPSILRFMNIAVPDAVAAEFDGVPFIGDISVSNLKAERRHNKFVVSWKAVNPEGELRILISTTNNFAANGKDSYAFAGKAKVSSESYTFDAPAGSNADVIKILLSAPKNSLNTWVVKKQ
jgi:arylsulfatase A-like enzyme